MCTFCNKGTFCNKVTLNVETFIYMLSTVPNFLRVISQATNNALLVVQCTCVVCNNLA